MIVFLYVVVAPRLGPPPPPPPWGPGGDRLGWGHIKRLYKAPTDYTKPQNIIQRHKILDKDIT